MVGENHKSSTVVVDEAYKSSIQPVVDNNMRTDILGPHFCRILSEHKPASDALVKLITSEINKDPGIKKAIKEVITEYNKDSKMKYVNAGIGAFSTVLLGLMIWGVEHLISYSFK